MPLVGTYDWLYLTIYGILSPGMHEGVDVYILGRRQVVSHRVLAPACTGSNPVVPRVILVFEYILFL